jgi:hypothetical protein
LKRDSPNSVTVYIGHLSATCLRTFHWEQAFSSLTGQSERLIETKVVGHPSITPPLDACAPQSPSFLRDNAPPCARQLVQVHPVKFFLWHLTRTSTSNPKMIKGAPTLCLQRCAPWEQWVTSSRMTKDMNDRFICLLQQSGFRSQTKHRWLVPHLVHLVSSFSAINIRLVHRETSWMTSVCHWHCLASFPILRGNGLHLRIFLSIMSTVYSICGNRGR